MKTEIITIAEHKKRDKGFELYYRLDIAEIRLEEGVFPSYSIYTSIDSTVNTYHDETTIHNVTSNREVAMDLFKLIYRGSVTPLTLADVTEDFLSDH